MCVMFSKVALTFSRKLHLKNQPVLILNQARLPKWCADDSRAQGMLMCPSPAPAGGLGASRLGVGHKNLLSEQVIVYSD